MIIAATLRAAGIAMLIWASPVLAQAPVAPSGRTPAAEGEGTTTRGEAPPPVIAPAPDLVYLSANLAGQTQPLRAGLHWRIFRERAADDGTRPVVAESREAAPSLKLPEGVYVVHVGYGLASASKRITVKGASLTDRLTLSAGGLRVNSVLGDKPLPRGRVAITVFVPDRGNPEAKLVVSDARPGDLLRLPEGNYHIVSTYLDSLPASALTGRTVEAATEMTPTNSVVTADLRVPSGKLIDATLKHRAATMTLKLVNASGGEALPNTIFTVLTPGGDVVRELRGAFPSLVLAEGQYVAIARNNDKTYQTTFRVTPALDRDVEIVAQ